eukprot:981892-Pyramimonas_sp.AAC.1
MLDRGAPAALAQTRPIRRPLASPPPPPSASTIAPPTPTSAQTPRLRRHPPFGRARKARAQTIQNAPFAPRWNCQCRRARRAPLAPPASAPSMPDRSQPGARASRCDG